MTGRLVSEGLGLGFPATSTASRFSLKVKGEHLRKFFNWMSKFRYRIFRTLQGCRGLPQLRPLLVCACLFSSQTQQQVPVFLYVLGLEATRDKGKYKRSFYNAPSKEQFPNKRVEAWYSTTQRMYVCQYLP